MNDKLAEKAMEYVESIAQSLGVAASHVYEVMLRQTIVEGIVYSALCIVAIGLLTFGWAKGIRRLRRNWDDIMDSDLAPLSVLLILFTGIGSAIAVVVSFVNLPEYVMKVVNPQYYVIREILSIFK